jgi:hypothetical protein
MRRRLEEAARGHIEMRRHKALRGRRAVDNLLQRVPHWRQHARFDHRADHARRSLVRRETLELLLGLGRELGAWRLRNDLPEFLFRVGV